MGEVTVLERTEEAFYTIKSLARRWDVTTKTVKNIIGKGELPVYRIASTAVRIDPADVKSYEQRNREVRSAA